MFNITVKADDSQKYYTFDEIKSIAGLYKYSHVENQKIFYSDPERDIFIYFNHNCILIPTKSVWGDAAFIKINKVKLDISTK